VISQTSVGIVMKYQCFLVVNDGDIGALVTRCGCQVFFNQSFGLFDFRYTAPKYAREVLLGDERQYLLPATTNYCPIMCIINIKQSSQQSIK